AVLQTGWLARSASKEHRKPLLALRAKVVGLHTGERHHEVETLVARNAPCPCRARRRSADRCQVVPPLIGGRCSRCRSAAKETRCPGARQGGRHRPIWR